MNQGSLSWVNAHTIIWIGAAFIAFIVIVTIISIALSTARRKKIQVAQDELARLEGRLVSGGKLSEAEGIRMVQLQQQVQNFRDRQRNAAVRSAGAAMANQINMRNGL